MARLNDDQWAYALTASAYQGAIGTEEGEVIAEVRLMRGRREPEVSVYLDGRKVGRLNAKASARLAPIIEDRAPDTLRIELLGRVIAMDGGRLYGVQVRYPD